MNINTDNKDALENANKYLRALNSDYTLYFSGDQLLASDARKALAISSLQLVEKNLDIIKKQLG